MNQPTTLSSEHISFKEYLFKDRRNRKVLILAGIAVVIQFSFFKYLYPFANYIHGDSFSYIKAATENLTISTYPIGYSKFLRLFSVFAKPDITLVGFQYLFVQCSALFLLFTIFYFYKPAKITQYILLGFAVLNPLLIHLANMVSSDCFFLSLSMIWLGLLVWIMNRPSNRILIWHAVILFIAFTTRYNALMYPVISALVFWLSKFSLRKKIMGVGLAVALCGWFVGMTMFQYKKLTGYWQFSPFSGWQFANNAMYAYREVNTSLYTSVPEKFRALDDRMRKLFKRARGGSLNPFEQAQASTVYMWSKGLPLMKYRDSLFKNTKDSSAELKKWASMGPLYKEYGIYIIKKYPLHFLTYFAGPNLRKYFAPPIEFLKDYNDGKPTVPMSAVKWFGYKNKNVKIRMEYSKTWVLNFLPILNGISNFVLLLTLLYYFTLKGWRNNPAFTRLIITLGAFWLFNAGFTVFASSAALRFQSFPVLLNSISMILMVDWLQKLMLKMKLKEQEAKNSDILSPGAIA